MSHVEKYQNTAFYACLTAICVFLFVETFSFEKELGAASSTYGPEFFPRILLLLIGGLTLVVAGRDILRPAAEKPRTPAAGSAASPAAGLLRAAGLAAACAVGAFVWDAAGFLAGAGSFALGACLLLRPTVKGIVAIFLFIPAAWFFFTRVFMVNL